MNVITVRKLLNSILNATYFLIQSLPENGELPESSSDTLRTYNEEILTNSSCIAYIVKRLEGEIDEE